MNLTALREKVKNIIDYSPDLQQFNDQLDQLLNDAYYYIWTMKRWTFATEEAVFPFYVDILPDRDVENVVLPATTNGATWVQNERSVVFDFAIDRLIKTNYQEGFNIWEGQPISIEDREYIIVKVVAANNVLVDRPIVAPTPAVSSTNWVIKKRHYDLPENCLELLYLGHRDYPYNTSAGAYPPYGKATALMARREEQLDLRADYKASYAECYVWSPAYEVRPAEKLSLVENPNGGNFANGDYYELCWAFLKDGKVGALSEPQTIQITGQGASAIRLNFLGWDDEIILADPYNNQDENPTPWRGHRKVIFWNKNLDKATGERRGLPCWLQVINGGATRNVETYNEPVIIDDQVGLAILTNVNQLDNGAKRYIEIDGQHQQVRPYPRVDGFDQEIAQIKEIQETITYHDFRRDGIIRYYKKPEDLLLQTDSPEMPYEYHQLIVYKALEDIYLKMGQETLSETYRRRIEKEIKELQKRYCDHVDSHIQRGQFGAGRFGWRYDAQSLKRLN